MFDFRGTQLNSTDIKMIQISILKHFTGNTEATERVLYFTGIETRVVKKDQTLNANY